MTFTYASRLLSTNEYVVASWGQSTNNAKGLRSEAVSEGTHLVQVNGFDCTVTAISGSTVTVLETFATNSLVGMELRLIWPVYGQSTCPARAGKATVTANTGTSITVSWDVSGSVPASGATGHSFISGSKVSYTTHPYKAGDRVVFGGTPLPAELTAGAVYYVVTVNANDFQLSASLGGTAITFSTASTGSTISPRIGAYLHWADGRGLSYSNVRVLTPYLPEAPGGYPTGAPYVAGKTFPASITSYEQAALFLDFTFNEGVDGYGFSNSGGTVTYGSNTMADSSLALATDILKGATLQITGAGVTAPQLMTVASNNATTLTFTTAWTAVPATGTDYEVSVPHYRDNPHSRTVGFGFRAPSNHHQPGFLGTGYVYNRPRGRLTPSYVPVTGSGASAYPDYRMGQMFEMGWRLASNLGRRINIVHLSADSSALQRSTLRGGSPATLGWWRTSTYLDWIPETGDNLAARLKNLITVSTAAALTAEGNAKPAKFLGEVVFQGESEVLTEGRNIYATLMSAVHGWLRNLIHAAGLSYYPNPQDLPVIHAGYGPAWIVVDAITGSLVSTAVHDWTALDPAADTIDISTEPTQALDSAHFTGLGEYHCGNKSADALSGLIEDYVSQAVDDNALEICNTALSLIGESGRVFSLDTTVDTSEQARQCARYFGQARDSILEGYAWSFAVKTTALTEVTKDEIRTDWSYAYAPPTNLAVPLSVSPPGVTGVVDSVVPTEVIPYWRAPQANVNPYPTGYKYAVERNASGQKVIYTHVADAVMRYCTRVSAAVELPMKYKRAVAYELASLLVGVFVRGEPGLSLSAKFKALAKAENSEAAANDANRQQNVQPPRDYPWNR